MNANRGSLGMAVVLGACVSALGQVPFSFDSTTPGRTAGSPAEIATFQLEIPRAVPQVVLAAHYVPKALSRGVFVKNTSGFQWASYDVTIQTVELTLTGTGLATPLVLSLGPLTGRAEDVPAGGSREVIFSPSLKSGAVSAMLAGASLPATGDYTLTWWVSAVGFVGDGGKEGQIITDAHHTWGTVSLVPEPSTYALVAGLSLVAFSLWRRRPGRGKDALGTVR